VRADLSAGAAARAAALQGALGGLAYATAECAFAAVLPRLLGGAALPLHVGFTLLLFAAYPAAGALLGLLLGPLLCRAARRAGRAPDVFAGLGAALPAGALAASLSAHEPGPRMIVLIALCAAFLVAAFLRAAAGERAAARLRPYAGAWTASLAIAGAAWIALDYREEARPASAALLTAGFVLAVLVTARMTHAAPPRARRALALALVLATAAAGVALNLPQGPTATHAAGGAVRPDRKDVVLITLDTVRADRLSLYGSARRTSPFLERLAAESIVFDQAQSSADMTLPSHASMFTGRYACEHGAHNDPPERPYGRPLGEELPTLAGLLAADGYATAGIAANYAYLDPLYGLDRGFGWYHAPVRSPWLQRVPWFLLRDRLQELLRRWVPRTAFDRKTWRAEEINAEAFELLDGWARRGERFFLFLNYFDAHSPYLPPEPYRSLFPGRDPTFTSRRYLALAREVMTLRRDVTPAEREHLHSQYDGALAYLDHAVEQLVDHLKAIGRYDDCLIVVTSDHGEAFGLRRLVGHGVSAHADQVHVPLILKPPGGGPARRVAEPVSQVGLMPAALALAGCAVPADLAGRSLLGPDATHTPPISESFPHGTYSRWHARFRHAERSIVAEGYRLVLRDDGRSELYDVARDPDETDDVGPEHPDVAARLEARLRAWLKACAPPASAGTGRHRAGGGDAELEDEG
jgi:arylsulfatase A-like enzyme